MSRSIYCVHCGGPGGLCSLGGPSGVLTTMHPRNQLLYAKPIKRCAVLYIYICSISLISITETNLKAETKEKITERKSERDSWLVFPKATFFSPTDYTLVHFYLYPRLRNEPISPTVPIAEMDLYQENGHPRDFFLAEERDQREKQELFFFTPLKIKTLGARPRRRFGEGVWLNSSHSPVHDISDEKKVIAQKYKFSYKEGGRTTGYVLHEYRAPPTLLKELKLEHEVALCKVIKNIKTKSSSLQVNSDADSTLLPCGPAGHLSSTSSIPKLTSSTAGHFSRESLSSSTLPFSESAPMSLQERGSTSTAGHFSRESLSSSTLPSSESAPMSLQERGSTSTAGHFSREGLSSSTLPSSEGNSAHAYFSWKFTTLPSLSTTTTGPSVPLQNSREGTEVRRASI